MAIHLYEDSALTQQVSEGDLSNPDDDTYNGTDGEAKDKELFLANEQTTLAAPLASGETSLQLSEPRFTDGEVIIIDNEQMRVLSGGGSTTLGVNAVTAERLPPRTLPALRSTPDTTTPGSWLNLSIPRVGTNRAGMRWH